MTTIDWPLAGQPVTGRNWIRIPADLTGLALTVSYSTATGEAKIYILFRSVDGVYDDEAIRRYAFIAGRRREVESKIGESVRWYNSSDTDGGYGLMTTTAPMTIRLLVVRLI